ncbi:hypothetical protein WOLCODRAFT_27132 [Wolfiporia cocos MD-104 SS10]|uniref:Uncharacterized protein n=1 Tax=Wolfiporia cocos (strain MD-104) TaxID=742152 RepID=A0A2H3JSH0_WOLCO|nr:hypothetical protein WOLCODRAFT_27132 [Wolfiporia cocos MD-104 SS10]
MTGCMADTARIQRRESDASEEALDQGTMVGKAVQTSANTDDSEGDSDSGAAKSQTEGCEVSSGSICQT